MTFYKFSNDLIFLILIILFQNLSENKKLIHLLLNNHTSKK
jgi:hypothetical protein